MEEVAIATTLMVCQAWTTAGELAPVQICPGWADLMWFQHALGDQ